MTPNVLICRSEKEMEEHFATDFIVNIDGKKALTLRDFYNEITDLLEIPDFGFNLDALSDALSDLQWLEEKRIVLYFTNANEFISKERDPAKIGSVLNILDAVAEDWKWAEDEIDEVKELLLVFEESERIRKLLEKERMNYRLLSALK